MIQLELLGRAECHLCDEMKAALAKAVEGFDVSLTVTDIDTDPELVETYGHDVPVLLVNGSKAFKHRATEAELRARLRKEPG